RQAVVQMKRLKDENERLLQALGDAVLGTDADGVVSFCNASACALLDRERDSLLSRPITQVLPIVAGDDSNASWQDSPIFARCSQGEAWEGDLTLESGSEE